MSSRRRRCLQVPDEGLKPFKEQFYPSLLINQGIDSVNRCVYIHTIYYLPLIFCLNKWKVCADGYLDSCIASFNPREEDRLLLCFLQRVALEASPWAGLGSHPSHTIPLWVWQWEGAGTSPSEDTRHCVWVCQDSLRAGSGNGERAASHGQAGPWHWLWIRLPQRTYQLGVFQPVQRLEEGLYAVCEYTACIYWLISTDMLTTHRRGSAGPAAISQAGKCHPLLRGWTFTLLSCHHLPLYFPSPPGFTASTSIFPPEVLN